MRTLLCCVLILAFEAFTAHAGILRQGKTLLLCHRTANRDLPENTLESLALAARMGCDIVEVDVTRTLDGELVLNHDNFLDRFTNSTGEVENTDLRELDRMDFGAWRGERFHGMRIAHFDDALRLARELNIDLYLDLKSKGIGSKVLGALAREGMKDHVMFGGEWADVKSLDPGANPDVVADLQPGFSREDIEGLHAQGKAVIANFILNGHETDLQTMQAAVAGGVDGIMVDYPRLGAEAVGRPVEGRIGDLSKQADSGATSQRVEAIRDLSEFTGFPLQRQFLRWIEDSDDLVSHEAALALVTSLPTPRVTVLQPMTHSAITAARRNAAWAIGWVSAHHSESADCVPMLLPMLDDPDPTVAKEALLAATWCPYESATSVPTAKLLNLLHKQTPIIRGLAAVALAKYHPDLAVTPIREQLRKEESEAASYDAGWAARGRAKLTQPEIDKLIELYRAQMKYIQAISMLPNHDGLMLLVEQAFRSVHDYSNVIALVAGYQLWDRLADHPQLAIEALASPDREVADRAQWALVEAGPEVLPSAREALRISLGAKRERLIAVLAWQGDEDAIPLLRQLAKSVGDEKEVISWAISKIQSSTNASSHLSSAP